MRGFEAYTLGHVDELTVKVQGLANHLQSQEAETNQRMSDLGRSIQGLQSQVLALAEAPLPSASDKAAEGDRAAGLASPEHVGRIIPQTEQQQASSSTLLSRSWADSVDSKVEALQKMVIDLQASASEIPACDASPRRSPPQSQSSAAQETGIIASPSPPLGESPPSCDSQGGSADAEGLSAFSSRLARLEQQSAAFQRFLLETNKRTSDLTEEAPEQGRLIDELARGVTSSSGGDARLQRSPSDAIRPDRDDTPRVSEAGASASRQLPPAASLPVGPSFVPLSHTSGAGDVLPGAAGGTFVVPEQLTSFEFKITHTLNQVRLAPIAAWLIDAVTRR